MFWGKCGMKELFMWIIFVENVLGKKNRQENEEKMIY